MQFFRRQHYSKAQEVGIKLKRKFDKLAEVVIIAGYLGLGFLGFGLKIKVDKVLTS